MNLKDIEEQLPASKFLRIHKSFIVGIESITSIRKNSVFIKEMELPVGETFRDSIQKITGRRE